MSSPMISTQEYPCPPLNNPEKEIRLLELRPSSDFETIPQCYLCSVILGPDLEFDALSWCWVEEPATSHILLEDAAFICCSSLVDALKHIRHSALTIRIWIDAVCINQRLASEKEPQIQLMRSIYSQAATVHIWLGRGTPECDRAAAAIAEDNFRKLICECGMFKRKETLVELTSLFSRAWWTRTWTFQELCLARHAIFHCGEKTYTSVQLTNFYQYIVEEKMNDTRNFCTTHHFDGRNFLEELRSLLNILERLNIRLMHQRYLQTLSDANFPCHPGPKPPIDFDIFIFDAATEHASTKKIINPAHIELSTLVQLTSSRATDERDKVFGCLGLLPLLSTIIRPNYSLPLEIVYILTTLEILRLTGDLSAFAFVLPRRKVALESNGEKRLLPSWALDFSRPCARKNYALSTKYTCSAIIDDNSVPFIPLEWPYLQLQSIYVDTIVACHHANPSFRLMLKRNILWYLYAIRQLLAEYRIFFGLTLDEIAPETYISGGTAGNAFWATLIWRCSGKSVEPCDSDSFLSSKAVLSEIEDILRSHVGLKNLTLLINIEREKIFETPVTTIVTKFESTVSGDNMWLFKTQRGYFGASIGHTPARIGDQIHIVRRGKVPLALRPVRKEGNKNVFELGSECYVHGLMHGEAFRPSPQPSSKQYKRHEFRRNLFGGASFDERLPFTNWQDILLT